MSTVTQRTFGEVVGLDSIVSIKPHPNDDVICVDTGETKTRRDCLIAADGTAFDGSSERFDHEVKLVREHLEAHVEWEDVNSRSDDYTDQYHFLVGEDSSTLMGALTEWADNHTDSDSDDYPLSMRESICRDMLEQMEVKVLEGYTTYGAPDIVLGDYECGEIEIQVDVAEYDVLVTLAGRDDLEGILEELDGEFYINSTRKSIEVDGKIVRWEHDRYVSGGCFSITYDPDCRYVFGLSDEAMVAIWEEHAEKVDVRLYKVNGEYSAEMFFNVPDDFASDWIRGKVGDRYKSDCVEFITHHDFASKSVAEHRGLLTALAGILEKASDECPPYGDTNAIIAAWAKEALSDAKGDFANRYPNEDCA